MSTEDPLYNDDAAAEETAPNRTFLFVAGALGVGFVLMVLVILGFVFYVRPGQVAANQTQVAARQAENAAIEATNAQIVMQMTSEAVPSNTLPAPTAAAALPTGTSAAKATAPALSTPQSAAGITATPTRLSGAASATPKAGATTAATHAAPTATPPRELANTGFGDEAGLPALLAAAAGLVVLVVAARRLRHGLR